MQSIADLSIDEQAVVVEYDEGEFALSMMQMGIVPGKIVRIIRTAPSGNPIVLQSGQTRVAIRLEDAQMMKVKTI